MRCPSHPGFSSSLGAQLGHRLWHALVCVCTLLLQPPSCRARGPWCREAMQGKGSLRKLLQKGCCQESQGGVVRVVYALHPWMHATSPGHVLSCPAQVSTSTHPMLFPRLSKSRRVMGLAGGCRVQGQEQGRVGEWRDVTRALRWLSAPRLQTRRQMEEEVPSPCYRKGLLKTSPWAARGCSGGRGSQSRQETGKPAPRCEAPSRRSLCLPPSGPSTTSKSL